VSGTLQQSAYLVEDRVEEPRGAPVFWSESFEIYTALIEAISEATLLVGRPTQIVNVPYSVTPNTPWQSMPDGVLAITDIQGPGSEIWKWTLRDQDYTQVGNGSDWENDVTSGQTFARWWPVGFTGFGIWPSIPQSQTVTVTGIASPVISTWPYSGSQAINLHDEFLQAVEKYAAHYLRIKESGEEFQSSIMLYEGFVADMKRMTAIEDRRDPYIFTRGVGAAADRGQVPDQR
jgi:hypothetical protein